MQKERRFVYFTAVDISVDDGAGINEREFVRELQRSYGDQCVCVLPYPAYPQNYYDERIEYVVNHRRHRLAYWLAFVGSASVKMMALRRKYIIQAFVFRLDIVPIVECLLCFSDIPVILKTLAGGTFKARRIVQTVKDISAPLKGIIMKRASAADAVGMTSRRWVMDTYGIAGDRITVIPNAANVQVFTPGSQTEFRARIGMDSRRVVGYVGALRKISCIDLLIHAMAKLDDDVCLVLVGAGPERANLERLASELGLRERVIFTGNIPYQDVPVAMRSFDVAIDLTASPISIKNRIVYASYSQKIPQYLACGIPVIAWDLEDTEFLAREQVGRVVPHGNTDGLAEALSDLLNMTEPDKAACKSRARRYAEQELSFARSVEKRVRFWSDMT